MYPTGVGANPPQRPLSLEVTMKKEKKHSLPIGMQTKPDALPLAKQLTGAAAEAFLQSFPRLV